MMTLKMKKNLWAKMPGAHYSWSHFVNHQCLPTAYSNISPTIVFLELLLF